MTMCGSRKSAAFGLLCTATVLSALAYGCSGDDPGTSTAPRGRDSGTDASKGKDTGPEPVVDAASADVVAPVTATVAIASLVDGGASGIATFVESNGSVVVSVTLQGPPGVHGLHVHAGSSCGDTTSDAGVVTTGGAAGGHFNPADAGHGYPDAGEHHAGDLGNITLDDAGKGTLSLSSTSIRVSAGETSVVNHALVVHANVDDGTTPPSGNSGGRLGCGVVQRN